MAQQTIDRSRGHVAAWLAANRGLLALLAVFVLGCLTSPRQLQTGTNLFLQPATQASVLFEYAEFGILAAGMTLVILTGGIDLSVGSVLGLCAVAFGLFTYGLGWPPALACPVVIALGVACGFLNGAVICGLRLQPFVATLAMMVAARGAAKFITGGIKAQPGAQPWYAVQSGDVPFIGWMTEPLVGRWFQPMTVLFLVTVVVLAVLLRNSRVGRAIYAVGGNEEAGRLSGLRTDRVKLFCYSVCGLTAALAGIMDCCQLTLGNPEAGATYELDAIAAVVIGGTSLSGGRGGVLQTFLGCLIMAYIAKMLSLNAVPEAMRLMLKGAIIIAAVVIQTERRRSR